MSAAPQRDSLGTIISRGLASAFFVRAGESWPVMMLLLQSFFLGLAQAFLYTVGTAMFLGTQSITTLPGIYIGSAVVVILSGMLYDRLQNIIPVQRLLPVTLLVITVMTLMFSALAWMHLEGDAWYYGLMVWYYLVTTLINIQALALPSLIFDIRQAKRLFGLISSGELLASMLGYLLVPVLVNLFGASSLVTAAAITFLLGTVVLMVILQRYRKQFAAAEHKQQTEEVPGSIYSPELLKDRYIIQLCLLVFFSLSSYYFIDFSFMKIAQGTGDKPDVAAIATFLGYFFALGEGLNFILKTFFSGRIVNKFGVRVSLSILPVLLLICTVLGGAFSPAIGFAAALSIFVQLNKLFDTVFRSAVHDPGFAILFQPLRPRQRMSAQTLTQGIVDPLSMGVAGVALLFLSQSEIAGTIVLVTIVLVMTAGWIVVTYTINRDYTSALMRAMKGRVLDGGGVSLDDMTSRRVLLSKLKSPLPNEVIYALDILEKNHDGALEEAVMSVADHPEESVRVDVLERVARQKLASMLSLVTSDLAEDTPPKVRAAAVKAYCALYEEDAVDKVATMLDDPNLDIRIGAMTGLLRNGGIDGILVAAEQLIRMGSSPDSVERQLAARIIGEVGVMSFYRPLRDLMQDPVPAVQDAALQAAGRIRNMRLLPVLVEALSRPHVHTAAAAAMASFGAPALPALGALFRDRPSDVKSLIRASRIIGRVRGEAAIDLLKFNVVGTPEPVRNQLLTSLNLCQYRAGREDAAFVTEEIRTEVSYAFSFIAMQEKLVGEGMALLRDALQIEQDQIRYRMFYMLSFLYDPRSIFRARDNLVVRSREHRAFALEMLDMEITADVKKIVFPLIEELSPAERIERLAPSFPQPDLDLPARLRILLGGPDNHINAWTKACALRIAAVHNMHELLADIEHILQHPEPYVQETALCGIRSMNPDRYATIVASVRETDPYSLEPLIRAITSHEGKPMLLTIEKVIILKTVAIFSETPEDVLVEVASILAEEVAAPGQTIIKKGEVGNCMYIIHEGKVRVHNGNVTLAELGSRMPFGEFSLLDNDVRSADITAVEETVLLRLDQEAFYEIMSDRIEVARGIISELTKRVRRQNEELAKLKTSAK